MSKLNKWVADKLAVLTVILVVAVFAPVVLAAICVTVAIWALAYVTLHGLCVLMGDE